MGLWGKIIAGLLGLLLIGGPLWPVALVFFLYLGATLRPKRHPNSVSDSSPRPGAPWRYMLALFFFVLSTMAYAVGGSLSPAAFFVAGAISLFWPALSGLLAFGEVVPVGNSIVLRSRFFPLVWHALGELKPGPESFPRALSSFSGTLLVFTDIGRAYALATSFTFGRGAAEAELNRHLRSAAPGPRAGAFLLPLDSQAAASVLRLGVSRIKAPLEDLGESAPNISGLLVIRCHGAKVHRAGAYEVGGPGRAARIPGPGRRLDTQPLLWEVLEGVGSRTRWPDPDAFSSLLESLAATRGEPLGERLRALDNSEGEVSVQSLGGTEVTITRPQLRALVSIYS